MNKQTRPVCHDRKMQRDDSRQFFEDGHVVCEAIDLLAARTRTTNAMIAEATGLDHAFVYRVRKGERDPSSDVVERICSALPISAAQLYKTMAKIAERRSRGDTVTLAG